VQNDSVYRYLAGMCSANRNRVRLKLPPHAPVAYMTLPTHGRDVTWVLLGDVQQRFVAILMPSLLDFIVLFVPERVC
jgi:hypothetical protein